MPPACRRGRHPRIGEVPHPEERAPDEIGLDDLEELIVEAWLVRAPKRLVKAYLAERAPDGD